MDASPEKDPAAQAVGHRPRAAPRVSAGPPRVPRGPGRCGARRERVRTTPPAPPRVKKLRKAISRFWGPKEENRTGEEIVNLCTFFGEGGRGRGRAEEEGGQRKLCTHNTTLYKERKKLGRKKKITQTARHQLQSPRTRPQRTPFSLRW